MGTNVGAAALCKMDQTLRNKLISTDEVYELDIDTVRQWCKEYINPGIEDVIYSFSFGEDLVERAEGAWMYFRKAGKVFDATGGMGVLNIGHNHPRILAVRKQFLDMQRMEVHKLIFSQYSAALSHNIAMLFDEKLKYSFFCNSGAEAVEGAIKTAYKYHEGKRNYILHSDVSYHGKLLGAGTITASKEVNFKFPGIPNTRSFAYNSIQSVRTLVDELRKTDNSCDIYAIIIEPYSISTFTPAENEFLRELRSLCDAHNIVLIFDEVFCGWYKTGYLFYFMKSGIYPDILAVSKALGGGKSSISAVISNEPVYIKAFGKVQDAYLHSTTYNGFGEECITAVEAINILIDEDIEGKTKKIEQIVSQRFDQMQAKHQGKFILWRGTGAFYGIKLKVIPDSLGKLAEILPTNYTKERLFIEKLQGASFCEYIFKEYGIYTVFAGQLDTYILFNPPAIISEAELEEVLQKIDSAISGFSMTHVFSFALKKFKKKLS